MNKKLPPTGGKLKDNCEKYDCPDDYIQVACDYFRCTMRPDIKGHLTRTLVPWTFAQLKKDFANKPSALEQIPRYNGIGCFPCNTNDYEDSVHHYYNTYEKSQWVPMAGVWSTIEMMLHHIFGNQYAYGLDYIQLMYIRPMQKLPILLLVSAERNTGKTTFLNLLKEIFGGNMVFTTNETFRSKFNSDRAGKLIVACDETLLNKKEDSEKLKALSTAEKSFIEYKGRDRFEIDNYAKYIFCSNNVSAPIYIDMAETRYWVRSIPSIQKINPGLLSAMKEEIPAFLHFLANRQLCVPAPISRMWFDPATLNTPALEYIKRACRPSAELELAEFLLEIMDEFAVCTLCYTTKDLGEILAAHHKTIRNYHLIISKQWSVTKATSKQAYDLISPFVDSTNNHRYGRYYMFTRGFLEGIIPIVSPTILPPAPEAAPASESTLFPD